LSSFERFFWEVFEYDGKEFGKTDAEYKGCAQESGWGTSPLVARGSRVCCCAKSCALETDEV
jgi:hypothetical protein